AVKDAVFERRSCGNGSKGPRYADWALAATASPRHVLLIRRLLSRPGNLAFYLCWAPEDQPATMTFFVTIAGRRWPCEETFKTGKDVLGWDQSQARTWDATCRHTALAALAQLRHAAIRNALCGDITLPPPGTEQEQKKEEKEEEKVSGADLGIPLGDAPVPARHRPGQAHHRRDRPADPPRPPARRRAHHQRPPRLPPALVPVAAPPPGPRPMAPLRHPPRRRSQHLTKDDR